MFKRKDEGRKTGLAGYQLWEGKDEKVKEGSSSRGGEVEKN